MADINRVTLIGRLTKDSDLKYTQGGLAISNFSIAVNRRRKSGDQWIDEVSYFDINLYGKPAESLKQYLTKGKQIAVDGELRQDRWEKDGQNHSRVVIVANNVQLLGGNSENKSNSSEQKTNFFVEKQSYEQTFDAGKQEFPEDIPF